MGVAPRRLWGWEPRTTTTYRYGKDGRLKSSVTVHEPEFDQSQYDLLAAAEELEADTGRYGELLSEACSPDADPLNRQRRFHYEAGILVTDPEGHARLAPLTNYAERAAELTQKAFYADNPDADRAGHFWPVRKVIDRE